MLREHAAPQSMFQTHGWEALLVGQYLLPMPVAHHQIHHLPASKSVKPMAQYVLDKAALAVQGFVWAVVVGAESYPQHRLVLGHLETLANPVAGAVRVVHRGIAVVQVVVPVVSRMV